MICSRYIYIGTFSGILTEKLTVWIITFMILAIAAMKLNILKLDDISEDKENKKVSERENNNFLFLPIDKSKQFCQRMHNLLSGSFRNSGYLWGKFSHSCAFVYR